MSGLVEPKVEAAGIEPALPSHRVYAIRGCDATVQGYYAHDQRPCSLRAKHDLGAIALCGHHYKQVFQAEINRITFELDETWRTRFERRYDEEAQRREAAQSVIYFAESLIGGALTGLVKIGRTIDLESRMRALEATALASVPGGATEEAGLHRRFRRDRVRGEWFRRSGDLDALIAEIQRRGGVAV